MWEMLTPESCSGRNEFRFTRMRDLELFRYSGLPLVRPKDDPDFAIPIFNAQPSPQGRFSLIRKLSLCLAQSHAKVDERSRVRKPQLAIPSHSWAQFLKLNAHTSGSRYAKFPILDELELDFSGKTMPEPCLEMLRVP